jgi:hypothetical protein
LKIGRRDRIICIVKKEPTMVTIEPLKSVSPARRTRLLLVIDQSVYTLRPLDSDPEVAVRAFQIVKADGTRYDVAVTPFGPECDCPDFIFRRAGIDPAGCKHIKALVEQGLIAG